MKSINLVIYDTEEEYVHNLTEYLITRQDFPYRIEAYTEEEALLRYGTEKQIDLFLVSESAYTEAVRSLKAGRTIILNESGETKWDELLHIKKYQSSEHIVREIMDYYVEEADSLPQRVTIENNVKIIGFFSPVRRCCQTSTGLTLGQILAEEHRTLYLNFESCAGFSYLTEGTGERDITDLLYCQEVSPERFALNLAVCIRKLGSLDYVPPMQSMQNLLYVPAGQWTELIKKIAETGNYEFMILDLSEGMQGLFEVLRMCCQVYTITKDDRYAKAKVEQYEQLLQVYEYQDVLEKTNKKRIPYLKEIPDGFLYRPGGEFARYVRQMLCEDGIYE